MCGQRRGSIRPEDGGCQGTGRGWVGPRTHRGGSPLVPGDASDAMVGPGHVGHLILAQDTDGAVHLEYGRADLARVSHAVLAQGPQEILPTDPLLGAVRVDDLAAADQDGRR